MANVVPKFYKKEITDALAAETLKVALMKNTYTPSANTDETYSGISAHEVTSSNYTAGGATLASQASAYVDTTNAAFDAANVTWSNVTFTARYAVIYETTGGKIRDIKDLGGDKPVAAGTFTLSWNADGILRVK